MKEKYILQVRTSTLNFYLSTSQHCYASVSVYCLVSKWNAKQASPCYVGQKCADLTLQHPLKVGQYCVLIWAPYHYASSLLDQTKESPKHYT